MICGSIINYCHYMETVLWEISLTWQSHFILKQSHFIQTETYVQNCLLGFSPWLTIKFIVCTYNNITIIEYHLNHFICSGYTVSIRFIVDVKSGIILLLAWYRRREGSINANRILTCLQVWFNLRFSYLNHNSLESIVVYGFYKGPYDDSILFSIK